jgi:hypothetical protein
VLEIAGGIILAVMFFCFFPLIVAGGVAVVVGATALLALLLLGTYWREALPMALFISCISIPFLLYERIKARYLRYAEIIDGKPPYDTVNSLPLRVVTTGITAFIGVLMAVVGMYLIAMIFDLL